MGFEFFKQHYFGKFHKNWENAKKQKKYIANSKRMYAKNKIRENSSFYPLA